MRTLLLFLIALASWLVSACSTTPQTRSTYLLRSESQHESGPLQVGNEYLGDVKVASYIDQSGLVLELADGVVYVAKQHHWAEPLRTSLRELLSVEIAAATGRSLGVPAKDGTRVEVKVSQLHGDADGNAVLIAQWSLSSTEMTQAYQFNQNLALEGTGYAALVAAERALLVQLARSIAAELK